MSKKILTIETIQAGQLRPYADTIYEAYISMKSEGMLLHNLFFWHTLSEDTVKELTRMFVSEFKDNPGPDDWHCPQLKICEPVGPSKEMLEEFNNQNHTEKSRESWKMGSQSRWHVLVKQIYLD